MHLSLCYLLSQYSEEIRKDKEDDNVEAEDDECERVRKKERMMMEKKKKRGAQL